MIPRPPSPSPRLASPPHAPRGESGVRRGCPGPDLIVAPRGRCPAPGGGPRERPRRQSRSPGWPPRPAPPTPFQVSWRVSRGEGSGARPPPRTPPPGGGGQQGGAGGRAGSALYLSRNSLPNAALHALTQKRGLSRRSARVLAGRVEILGFFPLRGPAGPLGRRLPKLGGHV